MNTSLKVRFASFFFAISMPASSQLFAQDWPQFNGPTRDGKLDAVYQLKEIPPAGLPKLWSAKISGGYSGLAVSGNKVIVTDFVKESGEVVNNPGSRDEVTGQERVLCFDALSGKQLWEHADGRKISVSFGVGPRATPAIDSGVVYTVGSEGDLLALDLESGKVVWQVSLKDRYKTVSPVWGYSSSPLVDEDRLVVLAGGEGSIVVALDKKTGEEIWRAGSATSIGYCPPVMVGRGKEQQLIIWDPEKLNGIDPQTGKVLWTEPLKPLYEMSIAPPIFFRDFMYVSGIGETSGMYRLKPDREGVHKVWSEKDPKTAVYLSNAAGIFREDIIAGADNGSGKFIGINPKTAERYWETMKPTTNTERRASHGTAFVFSSANGLEYIFSETGDFIIAKLTPEGYQEVSRQHLVDATNFWQDREVVWSYPAFANGNIYVRNDKELACFDLTP